MRTDRQDVRGLGSAFHCGNRLWAPVAAVFVQLEDWTQATWTHLCTTPASCPNSAWRIRDTQSWERKGKAALPGGRKTLRSPRRHEDDQDPARGASPADPRGVPAGAESPRSHPEAETMPGARTRGGRSRSASLSPLGAQGGGPHLGQATPRRPARMCHTQEGTSVRLPGSLPSRRPLPPGTPVRPRDPRPAQDPNPALGPPPGLGPLPFRRPLSPGTSVLPQEPRPALGPTPDSRPLPNWAPVRPRDPKPALGPQAGPADPRPVLRLQSGPGEPPSGSGTPIWPWGPLSGSGTPFRSRDPRRIRDPCPALDPARLWDP
ncbi:hypothetical protein R6Z07F_007921 [Ovis aries]